MAEQKEIFNTLNDGLDNGVAPDAKSLGDDSTTNTQGIIVYPATDQANQLEYLQIQNENNAVPTKAQAQMPVKDESGNLQYIPMLNGAIAVTSEVAGALIQGHSNGTVSTVGSYEVAQDIALSADKTYKNLEFTLSSFKDCTWKFELIDDLGGVGETISPLYPNQVRTGAGQYSLSEKLNEFEATTGGFTGSIVLRVSVKQRAGTGSDYSVAVSTREF